MKRIIGIAKPRPPPPSISDTIGSVDRKADDVRTKIAQCDAELVRLREQMNRQRNGSPAYNSLLEKAKLLLQRKKKYESLEGNLLQQSFTMELATSSIQAATTNQQILSAMKTSVKEIEKVNKKIDFDEIDDLQERMIDVLEISDGIQEALGRTFPGISDIDEDQLEAELEGIIMDEDKSYLDEATQNPVEPSLSTGPGRPPPKIHQPAERVIGAREPFNINPQTQNGIQVDEFGLPVIENQPSNV